VKIHALLFTAALALPSIALAESPTPTPTKPAPTEKSAKFSADEVKIVAHLHHVNQMEVTMGKDAKARGTAAVKRYGEMLIKDHSTADKELTALAKKKGLAKIPAATPATEEEKTEMKTQHDAMMGLKKLKGADFDREYLRMMVEGHDKELAKSDVFIATAQDMDLKTALEARKTSLQRHADAARELQKGNAQAAATPTPPAKTGN